MNSAYVDALAQYGSTLITHIGLSDSSGNEVSTRLPVTWGSVNNGVIRPSEDLIFDITSGSEVAQWVGYDASSGGTNYGGEALTPVNFTIDGKYTLLAAGTGIRHEVS